MTVFAEVDEAMAIHTKQPKQLSLESCLRLLATGQPLPDPPAALCPRKLVHLRLNNCTILLARLLATLARL